MRSSCIDKNININLKGKSVFISAGASGIGLEIAQMMLALGARVYACDINQSLLDEFERSHENGVAMKVDVAIFDEVKAAFSRIEAEQGQLDILINNAGVAGPTALVEDISITDWQPCLDVNINGPLFCTQLAVPLLKVAQGGSIINMASNAAFGGFPYRSAYTATKWAMIGLTKTWAMELGKFGVRVNALCPGSVEGPRINSVIERDANSKSLSVDQVKEVYLRQSALRTFVTAHDIANMACFLSSDLGRYISGQVIGIDGYTESLSNWFD